MTTNDANRCECCGAPGRVRHETRVAVVDGRLTATRAAVVRCQPCQDDRK